MPSIVSRSWQFVLPIFPEWVENDSPESYGDFQPTQPPLELKIVFGRGFTIVSEDQESAEQGKVNYEFYGYVESKLQLNQTNLRKWLPDARFIKTMIANRELSIKEITEHEQLVPCGMPIPWTIGGDKAQGKGQGERTDINDIKDILKKEGPVRGVKRIAEEYPNQFMRYHAGIEKLANILEVTPRDEDFEPNPFQKALIEEFQRDPHPRHIYWVYDDVGHSGKSRLLQHLVCEMGAIELGGREVDIAYGYNGERIVCFDIPRPTPLTSYADAFVCAERLKNGAIFSTKFMCKFKKFPPPHVIFFSNSPPPPNLWTHDRLQLVTLAKPPAPFSPFSIFGTVANSQNVDPIEETRAEIIRKKIEAGAQEL
jgi:hypothetical protein